ncbi:helix-turn-helix transcriptional regulator [Actinocorallia longicatena]|uniref:Helix-turn-helix transcriptional regulator n=1 Tax=Actinocorallia longicatena TaxID=111803 RepID=A0ABP6Q8Z6_9ACTN
MGTRDTLFGETLRRLRMAEGLSLAGLAGRAHYSKGYLSKVESGARPPTPQLARRCDAALGAGGALAALAGGGRPPPPAEEAAAPEDERNVWIMSLGTEADGWFTPVGRRELLAAGGSALLGLNTSPPAVRAAAVRETGLEAGKTIFTRLRALGQVAGPGLVLPTVVAQANMLRSVAAASEGPLREGWSRLAARHAEYAGWLAQEAGNPRAALWWTGTAVRLAGEADPDMAAHALVRRALITLYADDGSTTAALAGRARRSPAGRRVRGLAALREAQGHALTGDALACERAADHGALLLDGASAGSDPLALGSAHVDVVAVTRGWCLYDLGRPAEAAAVLEEQVARIPPDAHRSLARYGARLALAHATAGERERACEVTEGVLDAAAGVDSATIRTDLARLARTLIRWRSEPRIRSLYPRLTTVLHVSPN